MKKPTEERFWPKVERTDGCWNWIAGINSNGYGSFKIGDVSGNAHRYAYELMIGPIPTGMHIDHVCHNRVCVNPDHLRAVTVKQNHEHLAGATSNSKSGVRGVTPVRGNKWRADVIHHGRQHYLGRFETIAEAEAAVVAKRIELFTHNDADRTPNVI